MKKMLCMTVAEKGWDGMQNESSSLKPPYLLVQLFVAFIAHYSDKIHEATMFTRSIVAASHLETRLKSVCLVKMISQIIKKEQIQQLFSILLRDRAVSVRVAAIKALNDVNHDVFLLFGTTLRKMCLTDPAQFVSFFQNILSII